MNIDSRIKKWLLATLCCSIGLSAYAMPASIHQPKEKHTGTKRPRNEAPLMHATDPNAERFRAVGQLIYGGGGLCTATLVASSGQVNPKQAALLLTAGHCVSEIRFSSDANTVIVDQPAVATTVFSPNYFIDAGNTYHSYDVDRVLYATMKGTDIAILRLKATYGDLAAQHIVPLVLSAKPATNANIEIAHIPVEGIEFAQQYIRYSACATKDTDGIFLGELPWVFSPWIPSSCHEIRVGSSGSAVLLKGSQEVIGVINTGNTNATPCEENDPACSFLQKRSIANHFARHFHKKIRLNSRSGRSTLTEETMDGAGLVPITRIVEAFNADGTLNLSRLDPGQGVKLTRLEQWATPSQIKEEGGHSHPASWSLKIEEPFDYIRYKFGLANQIKCANLEGYSAPIASSTQPLRNLQVPPAEGSYLLCTLGRHATRGDWQRPEDATLMPREIDNTPPEAKPKIRIYLETDQEWLLIGESDDPDIAMVVSKSGPLKTTDCQDPNGYKELHGTSLEKKKAPWRFCAAGKDVAGNIGPANTLDLGK